MFYTYSIISIFSLEKVTDQINKSTRNLHTHVEIFGLAKKVTSWINGSTVFCTCSIISILSLDRVTGQINQSTPKWHTHIENFQSGKKVTGWINGSTVFCTCSIISILSLDRVTGQINQSTPKWHTHIENFQSGKKVPSWINGSRVVYTYIIISIFSLEKVTTKSTNQRDIYTHMLKFLICVGHFRVDLLIQPGNFFFKSEIFYMCLSFWCWFVDLAGNSIQRKYSNYTIYAKPCWSVDSAW